MSAQSVRLAVIMERRALDNRWQSESWQPVAVVADPGDAAAQLVFDDGARTLWLHPGFVIDLFRDEAEGYFLNMTTGQPFVFVMTRMEGGRSVPKIVTVSYNEAGRMMDGGEQVDGVPMPREVAEMVDAYVAANYRPETKKRIRPPSFKGARRDSSG